MWEAKDSDWRFSLEDVRASWTTNHVASSGFSIFPRDETLRHNMSLLHEHSCVLKNHNSSQHCFVGLDRLKIVFNHFLPAVPPTQKTEQSLLLSPILHLPPPVDPSLHPSLSFSRRTKTAALCWLSPTLGVRMYLFTGGRDAAVWVAVGGVEV